MTAKNSIIDDALYLDMFEIVQMTLRSSDTALEFENHVAHYFH